MPKIPTRAWIAQSMSFLHCPWQSADFAFLVQFLGLKYISSKYIHSCGSLLSRVNKIQILKQLWVYRIFYMDHTKPAPKPKYKMNRILLVLKILRYQLLSSCSWVSNLFLTSVCKNPEKFKLGPISGFWTSNTQYQYGPNPPKNRILLIQKILPTAEPFQLPQCLWLRVFSAIQFLIKVCKNPENLESDQPQTQMYYIENRILLNSPENPPSMWNIPVPAMSLASRLLSHPVSD